MKQPSTTATTSIPTGGSVVPGTSATDAATVSGGAGQPTPTGTVDFFLCQPAEVTAGGCEGSAGTQVGGDARRYREVRRTSERRTNTTAIGKYCWRAEYSGDGFYNRVDAHQRDHGVLHDAAAGTGDPDHFGPAGCEHRARDDGVGSGHGRRSVRCRYGDCHVLPLRPRPGRCSDGRWLPDGWHPDRRFRGACERIRDLGVDVECADARYRRLLLAVPVHAGTGKPVHGRVAHELDHGVLHHRETAVADRDAVVADRRGCCSGYVGFRLGDDLRDRWPCANRDGQVLPLPAGRVTAGGCEGNAGTQIGTPAAGETLAAGSVSSDSTANTTAIGKYCWRAEYSGDAFYNPSSHTNSESECFTTLKQDSHTTTTSSPTGGNVLPGSSATDHAIVAGGQGQQTPTGTVAFFLCQPAEVTAGGCEGSAGTKVGATKPLANGEATSDASTDTASNGTYCWRAEYSGDGFYNPSSHTNPSTECFTVESGTIKVIKDFVGAPVDSTVTLNIRHGDVVDETDASVPDGGHIGPKVLLPGAYVVNETSAGNNVDLDLYTSSIVCTKPGDGDPITVGSADGRLINVDLADGEAITCTITNTRKARSISVEKTVSATPDGEFVSAPDIATKPENGGTFYFKVKITNESSADTITVTSLADIMGGSGIEVDNLVCDGADQENLDGLPFELGPGLSKTCTFTHDLVGNAGDTETDHVDVSWKDGEGSTEEPESSNDAIIALTDVPSTITVTKTANPTVVQDSGPVTFTVVVRNDSAVDTVYIQTLTDSIYGDVNGKGTCTLEDGIAAGPAGSRQILPSASYTCTFTATVSQTETDVVTATGVDDDDQPVSDDDDATVTVNHTPPPPHVPATDISVTKAATPAVQLPQGGGTAPITYNLVVKNNGPDAAANVKVSDAAPANVSFVSATTSAGSCTTTAQALDCTITSLAPGASIAITVNATVNATGTKVNVVIVTTTTPETNTTNNTASASTVVTAPVTPPTPKPQPEICELLTVTPKVLKANGKAQKINVKVTKGKKPVAGAKVKITGPGINKTVKTGKNGKVTVTVKPGKPGIIRVAIQDAKTCNTQRIGVVGVYEPPVTG